MEDVTDGDYWHAKRVCEDFEIKNLLAADLFEKMCILKYVSWNIWTWPCLFPYCTRISMASSLKKTNIKLDLLADTDMLLMVEKGIKGRICHTIHWYVNSNNKYMKHYDKNKESSYLKYWDVNNLYWLKMSKKLLVNNFKSVEDISEFNEDFIKNYNDESHEWYFLEVDVQYPGILYNLHHDLPFLPKKIKTEKVENFVANLHNKEEYVIHITNLKALNHGLVLKKVNRIIKLIQKS